MPFASTLLSPFLFPLLISPFCGGPSLMASLPVSTPVPRESVVTQSSSRTPTFVDQNEVDDINLEFEHEAYGPAPGEKPEDSFEVIMQPDDPDNPKAWSRPYRWFVTMLSAVLVLNAYVLSSHTQLPLLTFALQNVHIISTIRSHQAAHRKIPPVDRSCHTHNLPLRRRVLCGAARVGPAVRTSR